MRWNDHLRLAGKRTALSFLCLLLVPILLIATYWLYEQVALRTLNLPELFPGRLVLLLQNQTNKPIHVVSVVMDNKINVVDKSLAPNSHQTLIAFEQPRYREEIDVVYQMPPADQSENIQFVSDRQKYGSCAIAITFVANHVDVSDCGPWPVGD